MLTTLGLWDGGTPLIDPMSAHGGVWVSIVPLAVFVALAYKSIRVREATARVLVVQTAKMAAQILAGMVVLGLGLHVFLEYVVPLLRG